MAERSIEVRVPDIGDAPDAEVVEILVAPGDRVESDDVLLSIESDKATLEIPSPETGVVESVAVKVGDKVSEGVMLLLLRADGDSAEAGPGAEPASESEPAAASAAAPAVEAAAAPTFGSQAASPAAETAPDGELSSARVEPAALPSIVPTDERPHASPLVRRQARELGVDLRQAEGGGPQGRVLPGDLKEHVSRVMRAETGAPGAIPGVPEVDWGRYGPVETLPLSRIRKASARNLTRAWLNVVHVTQHEEADITELEAFRLEHASAASERGVKLTLLPFVMKACVQALREFPDFRSSLTPDGEGAVRKHYYHLGVAVDTDNGLVVPVVRDVDQKGLLALSGELAELAERARARRLTPEELQGAVFSISSLGGIGGTHFTPIVNAPEVAILGVSRMDRKPVWDDAAANGEGGFVPRLMLPLSLSYDHRLIDGAMAVRFAMAVRRGLARLSTLLL